MDRNKTLALLMVALFFVWGGVSYLWYTCGIKNFCEDTTTIIHIGGERGPISVEHKYINW